ncbi:MAG TPA: protein kinase [Pyrinomonadaceae bacterium]|jgi:serine/threonine protein kinase|nr:protein kinase [Pyrinomonadaceae bacterium]
MTITPEHWQEIKRVFNAALDQKPEARPIFLDEACAGNSELRSEVDSLLSSYERTGEFIDAPAYEVAAGLILEKESVLTPTGNLGSYRILSTLGRGGMGEVLLAEDSRLGRKVALKLLPSSFTNDPDRLARFEREARAASALNHPNILTIYEVGSFDGRQFIASEYVEGETLRQRQLHSPLKLSEVLDVAVQVVSALAAAHQAHIVHRDIKPENIMLRPDAYAKVVDFGLAKLTAKPTPSSDTSLPTMRQVDTDTGVVMGTTAYMSPEQARGLTLDARTDIWSFGVVLYEMVSGVTPFKGATPSDLIVSILDREPAPLPATGSVIPPELDWIIRKALRKDREERYQTARELLGDLRSLKRQIDFAAQNERTLISEDAAPLSVSPSISTDQPRALSTAEVGRTKTITHAQSVAVASRKRTVAIAAALAALLVGAIFIGYKLWPGKKSATFQSMKITRLTNSGKVIDSIISPDGKYLVYVLSDAGKQSLWIRQVSIANDKLIVPAAQMGVFGITFTRDGNDVYYVIKVNMDKGTLYRVPALGGTPVKILEGVDAPVSSSPDGKQLAFLRGSFPNQGESALMIANSDGSGERILATRKSPKAFVPIFFTGPAWSPDGKLIATSVGSFDASFRIFTFAVTDGKETDLTPNAPWRFTARVEWLPDMSGLLAIAGEGPGVCQVWLLSYPGGSMQRITNDLAAYRALSIANDGTKFSTIQSSGLVNIWIAAEGDTDHALQLPTGNVGFFGSSGNTVSWTPKDGLVFISNESTNLDIWSMDANGENRKQLTSNAGYNFSPQVSPDGRYIVFVSNRGGNRNVWRMDINGNNPRQLTNGTAEATPTITPDNNWVIYSSLVGGRFTLWKVGIDGGNPVELTNRVATSPTLSPDGKYVAYMFPASLDPLAPPNRIAIMPIAGGEPAKVIEIPSTSTVAPSAHWSADGKSIMYTVNINNVTNIWSQPLDGGAPKQVSEFKDSLMTGFAWSNDGKKLACTRGVLMRDAVLISEEE